MGFPTDPTKYPVEFAALYRRALKEVFEIDLGDRNLAISYVHRLHAYRRAVEETQGIHHSSMRSTVIKQRGTRIIFDNEQIAVDAIRSAAGMHAPTNDELDKYLAQLEQGMSDDGSIQTTDSGESAIHKAEESQEVNTDYLSLFPKPEDTKDKE